MSLQSKLYGNDWGLLDNVSVGRDEADGERVAVKVRFRAGSDFKAVERTAPSGFGFSRRPGQLETATSACLNYAVWVPEDFDCGEGGVLPGLFGQSSTSPEATKFSVPMPGSRAARLLCNR